jgi:hypothetical protein
LVHYLEFPAEGIEALVFPVKWPIPDYLEITQVMLQ